MAEATADSPTTARALETDNESFYSLKHSNSLDTRHSSELRIIAESTSMESISEISEILPASGPVVTSSLDPPHETTEQLDNTIYEGFAVEDTLDESATVEETPTANEVVIDADYSPGLTVADMRKNRNVRRKHSKSVRFAPDVITTLGIFRFCWCEIFTDHVRLEILNKGDAVVKDLISGQIPKTQVATFINGADEISERRRITYLRQFSFARPLLPSLREFLSKFVLSGETQEQDRILYEFSKRYYECTREFTLDIIYSMVYSCILLNTDLHGAENIKHMTMEQYVKNTMESILVSSPDANKQFDNVESYLKNIYSEISTKAIMQPRRSSVDINGNTLKNIKTVLRKFSIRKKRPSITNDMGVVLAPHREGVLSRKHVMEENGRKAIDRKWYICYCKIVASDLLVFSMPSPDRLNPKALSQNDMQLVMHIPLRHALASPLPRYAYSSERPFCFQVVLPTGGIYLFQAYSETATKEWSQIMNYWAAMESREPLGDGIGIWYGIEKDWLMDFIPQKETVESQCRRFKDLSERSVSNYRPSYLPFVPQSMATKIEEQNMKHAQMTNDNYQPQSKLFVYNEPLGFNYEKFQSREDRIELWNKRLEYLTLELERLIYARELLRCLGIGRGVIDATSFNPADIQETITSSSAAAPDIVVDNAKSSIDIDDMTLPDASKPKTLGSLENAEQSNASLRSNGSNNSQLKNTVKPQVFKVGFWKPEMHMYYSTIPEGTLIVKNHSELVIRNIELDSSCNVSTMPRRSSLMNLMNAEEGNEKVHPLTVPAPLNIIVGIPHLPDDLLKALMLTETNENASEDEKLQNFMEDNPKMAEVINENWNVKFKFICSEIVKTFHYLKVLHTGVRFTSISEALQSMKTLIAIGLEKSRSASSQSKDQNTKPLKLRRQHSLSFNSSSSMSNNSNGSTAMHLTPNLRAVNHSLNLAKAIENLYIQKPNLSFTDDKLDLVQALVESDGVSQRMKDFLTLETGQGIRKLSEPESVDNLPYAGSNSITVAIIRRKSHDITIKE